MLGFLPGTEVWLATRACQAGVVRPLTPDALPKLRAGPRPPARPASANAVPFHTALLVCPPALLPSCPPARLPACCTTIAPCGVCHPADTIRAGIR
ncbi:hypothetical protein B0T22DRAFT_141172 [Podospora appendiculata]|uniref:Uncharacterized protein n=1 Tax=Podospora appendiculata TaxID=314037 RepID=A0AAE1CBY4_9PEZI|nr:hypothetical protein B0T22DRAFT_141172 [Podospora appendiculata]